MYRCSMDVITAAPGAHSTQTPQKGNPPHPALVRTKSSVARITHDESEGLNMDVGLVNSINQL